MYYSKIKSDKKYSRRIDCTIISLTLTSYSATTSSPSCVLHASKGTEVFIPQFSDKYVLEIIIPENMEEKVIQIIKQNATIGKIFVHPVLRTYDIKTGAEGEKVI